MSSALDRARALALAQDFGAEALRLNEQLVAADPSDVASRTRLARCYREAGRLDDSERQYREVLAIDPKNRIAAGGVASIEQARFEASRPAYAAAARPAPRERGASTPRAAASPRAPRAAGPPAPAIFAGLQPRDFAELRFCDASEVKARFAPRAVDLVKRMNALQASIEAASVREAGRRQLFRASRNDVHCLPGHWTAASAGTRGEAQFAVGMTAGRAQAGDWFRAGILFDLSEGSGSGRGEFGRFQEILQSAPRSLFLGWMIRDGGLIEVNHAGPRTDLHQPSQAAELIATCDRHKARAVFFGKYLSAEQAADAAVLAEPVQLVRTIDRVFGGLLPLWRALWE